MYAVKQLYVNSVIMFGIFQVRSAGCTHPGTKEELYEAVQRVLLCLDSLPDLLLTPGGSGKDDTQLRLLQQEVTQNNAISRYQLDLLY